MTIKVPMANRKTYARIKLTTRILFNITAAFSNNLGQADVANIQSNSGKIQALTKRFLNKLNHQCGSMREDKT